MGKTVIKGTWVWKKGHVMMRRRRGFFRLHLYGQWHRLGLLIFLWHVFLFCWKATKSKSHYDRRSVGQFVLVSCPFWSKWPDVTFIWVTITFFLFLVGRPLWREDRVWNLQCNDASLKGNNSILTLCPYNTFGTSRNFSKMFDTKNEWKSWV
jgi:hypothetical protein